MALLTQEAQGHMHCMNSGLQRGNWPCPLHVLEAAQPTPFPSSAEVILEQSEPPWASGSHLQGQLWGMSAAECLFTGNIPLALEDHRILEEEDLMHVNHQGHAHVPDAGEPRLGCWGNQTRWKYFSPFRLRAGSLHARNQENCLLLLVFLSTVYSLFCVKPLF